MDYNHKKEQKPKRSFFKIVLILVVIFLITGRLLWYYWPHFQWKWAEWRAWERIAGLERIPSSLMPEVEIPEDWIEHSLGCIQVSMPHDLLVDYRNHGETHIAEYRNENIIIKVIQTSCSPHDFLEKVSWLARISQAHPQKNIFLTMFPLYIEATGVVPADFRWSMSRKEVEWHKYLILDVRGLSTVKQTESFSTSKWEGWFCFGNDGKNNTGIFQWSCISCPAFGSIYFYPVDKGQELDLNLVRGVSQSMKVNCGCSPSSE